MSQDDVLRLISRRKSKKWFTIDDVANAYPNVALSCLTKSVSKVCKRPILWGLEVKRGKRKKYFFRRI